MPANSTVSIICTTIIRALVLACIAAIALYHDGAYADTVVVSLVAYITGQTLETVAVHAPDILAARKHAGAPVSAPTPAPAPDSVP